MRHHRRSPHGAGRRRQESWSSSTSARTYPAHGPMEQGIGDISRIYDGEIVFSEELMRITL